MPYGVGDTVSDILMVNPAGVNETHFYRKRLGLSTLHAAKSTLKRQLHYIISYIYSITPALPRMRSSMTARGQKVVALVLASKVLSWPWLWS